MAFSPMDGFFLAVFLAVCILVAVVLRCLCYRCCLRSCSDKFRHPNEDGILPRNATPTITPARTQPPNSHQVTNQSHGTPQIPPTGTVFTIYTFPQQHSPELHRPPRSTGPPKYSTVPCDMPPKYEDLFPITSTKVTTPPSSPSTAIEMQVAPLPSSGIEPPSRDSAFVPPSRDSAFVQAHTSRSSRSQNQEPAPAVPVTANIPTVSTPPEPPQRPAQVPKEAPPLYDTIYPQKSGE